MKKIVEPITLQDILARERMEIYGKIKEIIDSNITRGKFLDAHIQFYVSKDISEKLEESKSIFKRLNVEDYIKNRLKNLGLKFCCWMK